MIQIRWTLLLWYLGLVTESFENLHQLSLSFLKEVVGRRNGQITAYWTIKEEELCLLIEPPKQLFKKMVFFSPVGQTFELTEEPNCLACVEAEISAASNDNEVTIGKGIKMGTTWSKWQREINQRCYFLLLLESWQGHAWRQWRKFAFEKLSL